MGVGERTIVAIAVNASLVNITRAVSSPTGHLETKYGLHGFIALVVERNLKDNLIQSSCFANGEAENPKNLGSLPKRIWNP